MPEFVSIITSILVIAVVVRYFIKSGKKVLSKIVLSILAAVSIAFSLFGSYCNPYWNSLMFKDYEPTKADNQILSDAQAKADLVYALQYLKKDHPLFIRGLSEETRQVYDKVVSGFNNVDTVTVNSLQKAIQDIVSMLGDEHTSCWRYDEVSAISGNTSISEPKPFVYYEMDVDKNLAVLTLNNCWFNEEYIGCLKTMFTEIKKNGIGNVAVDLRNNGGGNSLVANEFIKYLNVESFKTATYEWRFGMFVLPSDDGIIQNERYENLLFDGNVYILTSSDTFSSAMLFAQYIKDNRLGKIIGQAPGLPASHYGEIATFVLPNSKLLFSVSTKFMWRADIESTDSYVSPDILCKAKNAMQALYNELV
jgi:C-terminal processing protease CtpA/Prc